MPFFVLYPWPRPDLNAYYADPSLKISTYSVVCCYPIAPGRALKQDPMLGPDNRDLIDGDYTSIVTLH
jgi:hypothetical protein